jgi:hypothetical protein
MILCGLAAVKQASVLDGLSFDPFSLKQDGLASAEVDIRRDEVSDTFMVSGRTLHSEQDFRACFICAIMVTRNISRSGHLAVIGT